MTRCWTGNQVFSWILMIVESLAEIHQFLLKAVSVFAPVESFCWSWSLGSLDQEPGGSSWRWTSDKEASSGETPWCVAAEPRLDSRKYEPRTWRNSEKLGTQRLREKALTLAFSMKIRF